MMRLPKKSLLLILTIGMTFLSGIYLAIGRVNHQIVDIENAPARIYKKYVQQKFVCGFSVNPYYSDKYVLITMGTVPTAGYEIQINRVEKKGDLWIIQSQFKRPDPDEIVAMVISYPAIIVKLPTTAEQIQVFANDRLLSQLE